MMKQFNPILIKPLSIVERNESIVLDNVPGIRNSVQRMQDAKNLPDIMPLIGDIWQTGELHLHFADTGVGKSTLAVAESDKISKGENFLFLNNHNNPMTVLYYDFELSDRQFRKRYTDDFGNEYPFSEKFYIDSIDFPELLKANPDKSFEDVLFAKIRHDIDMVNPQILVFDNITYLSMQTTQKTDVALETMRRLIDLKKEKSLSILVLAHTPKIDLTGPLTINSLAGSKHLSNFADSVSAIGKSSQGSNIRYIKQIKPSRNGEMIYDIENVITCELVKKGSMLTFEFIDFNTEYEHLKQRDNTEQRNEKIEIAKELHTSGKRYDEIALELLGSKSLKGTIYKWLNPKNQNPV